MKGRTEIPEKLVSRAGLLLTSLVLGSLFGCRPHRPPAKPPIPQTLSVRRLLETPQKNTLVLESICLTRNRKLEVFRALIRKVESDNTWWRRAQLDVRGGTFYGEGLGVTVGAKDLLGLLCSAIDALTGRRSQDLEYLDARYEALCGDIKHSLHTRLEELANARVRLQQLEARLKEDRTALAVWQAFDELLLTEGKEEIGQAQLTLRRTEDAIAEQKATIRATEQAILELCGR